MDFTTSGVLESLFEGSYFLSLDKPVMSTNFMSANTPPYDGSELEDEELLDKFLSDSAPVDNDDSIPDPTCSPASTCASLVSPCEYDSVSGQEILANIAMVSSRKGAKKAGNTTSGKKPGTTKINGKEVAQNRNAVIARENRARKKAYIQGLEESVEKLSKENDCYKSKVTVMEKAIAALATDAEYLRGVLRNQSDLAKILQAVSSVPGLTVKPGVRCVDISKPVQTINETLKRSAGSDSDEPEAKSRKTDPGICLHVQNGCCKVAGMCWECDLLRGGIAVSFPSQTLHIRYDSKFKACRKSI